jgi:hypothetical protein
MATFCPFHTQFWRQQQEMRKIPYWTDNRGYWISFGDVVLALKVFELVRLQSCWCFDGPRWLQLPNRRGSSLMIQPHRINDPKTNDKRLWGCYVLLWVLGEKHVEKFIVEQHRMRRTGSVRLLIDMKVPIQIASTMLQHVHARNWYENYDWTQDSAAGSYWQAC